MNSFDVGSCLCFDRDTGLFMDASWFGSGAYCYSNQQTGWACDLAGELLDNFGLVWDYLTGNGGDIGVLNGSTQGMLKTCNGMGILSGLFGGACLSDLGVLIGSIGLEDSFAGIVPLIGVVSSDIGGFSDYLYETASDPHFWSGVVGGMLFEAGMIASCTGVGLPVGLALMGAGTVCTAYGSGLFGVDETGGFYTNVTDGNLADFGFSMGLNAVGGGVGASAAKSTLRKCGGEAVQVSISRAVYNADQRGAYTTFHTLSSSTYVRKSEGGSLISGGQYLVDEVVGTTTKDNIKELIKISSFDLFSNYAYKSFKNQYLSI